MNVLARGERAGGVVCSNRVVWPSAAVMLVLKGLDADVLEECFDAVFE